MSLHETHHGQSVGEPADCYKQALQRLKGANIPFLVGGGYAMSLYTEIPRRTKDIDLFMRPQDVDRALAELKAIGCRTEISVDYWLAKAYFDGEFIDIVFGSANGVCPVDDSWFEHAVQSTVLGIPILLCPVEEALWQKAFIMERGRYDGADVAHLIRAWGTHVDWRRLMERFGGNWPVLLSHLTLFRYIYPDDRQAIPNWVMQELIERLQAELSNHSTSINGESKTCRGPLLSVFEYRVDLGQWGYRDPRLAPDGALSPEQVTHWEHFVSEDAKKKQSSTN